MTLAVNSNEQDVPVTTLRREAVDFIFYIAYN